ncbi:MAG TPA: TA system VapC family ribonuclease toxin [Candidatus Limnocylindrales bacterium]|nr:TA system VapC family ribonuclease toxin [Candidatus Limnocylindrales bacterium]
MSYTVDANLLVFASDEASDLHVPARAFVDRMAGGPEIAYLFWPTALAYLRISTHPAIFSRPLSARQAVANLQAILDLPHVRTAGEQDRFWARFLEVADDVEPTGNLVPDAHLVALMIENGVTVIWTHDRDFRKFGGITARDPFEGGRARRPARLRKR